MKTFTEFVARRKAWQVFLILVLPVFGSQFYLMNQMQPPPGTGRPPDMVAFDPLFRQMMTVTLLMVVLLLSWLVSIALAANRRIDRSLRPSVRWIVASAIYAAGYMVFSMVFFPSPASFASGNALPAFIVPLHFLATAAMFYVAASSARNLMMAERQSSVSFFDYAGPFFLMWFFPIGVWFVQPRVNKLAESVRSNA